MYKVVQATVSFIAAVITFTLGGWSLLLGSLIAMVVLDYITGVIAAAVHGRLNSNIGLKGISRKVMIFILVSVAHLIDGVLGVGPVVRDTVIYFYLSNEAVSIIENSIIMGLPVPQILINVVNQLDKYDNVFNNQRISNKKIESDEDSTIEKN